MTSVLDRPTPERPNGSDHNPRTLRTVLLVAGSIVLVAIVAYVILGAVLAATRTNSSGDVAISERFDNVTIETGVTDVDVSFADVDHAQVVFEQNGNTRTTEFTAEVVGSTLEISVRDRFEWFFPFSFGNDSSTLEVVLPSELDDLAVEVTSDVGDTALDGDFGVLRYDGNVGDLDLAGSATEAELKSDVGDVRAIDFAVDGDMEVNSTVGDVTLDLASVPSSMTVTSSVGSQRVTLPDGSYWVEASSDVGDATVEVDSDRQSSNVLRFQSSVGDITVSPRD